MLECASSLSGPEGPLAANTRAALALALLQLPEQFSELKLWEQIAGISYSGDPRMSVPGAENPEKVRNIVRGPGVLGAFRGLYAPHVAHVGLRWAQPERGVVSTTPGAPEEVAEKAGIAPAVELEWQGEGGNILSQPTGPDHNAALLSSLPLRVRQRLAAHFRPTIAGAIMDKEVAAERREIRERKKLAKAAKESRALYDDAEFWRRVAMQKGFVDVVTNGELYIEGGDGCIEGRRGR